MAEKILNRLRTMPEEELFGDSLQEGEEAGEEDGDEEEEDDAQDDG